MSGRRHQLLKGGSALVFGEVVVQLCGLLRNFLVARIISPDQFGIAVALAMSVSLVEMLSEFGAARFLTRLHGEDGGVWLPVAHGIAAVRGLVGAVVLGLIAIPLASVLNMSDAAWAFQLIAVVPLVRGFMHHEMWLAQRDLRYKAFVSSQMVPQIVTLLAAYPVALLLPDFRSLLALSIANVALSVAASHLLAGQGYRLAFDMAKTRRVMAFGLPLMADGLLMFVVLHGERIVVANAYGASLLGAYSAALLLASTPAGLLGRVSLSLGVPQLASLRDDRRQRDEHYATGVHLLTAPALGLAVLFGCAGGDFVGLIFGSDYAVSRALAAWLGLGLALRVVRTMPIVAAIAEGRTVAAMLGNVVRVAAVGVGWLLAMDGQDPWAVLAAGAAGELGAIVITTGLNVTRSGLPLGSTVVSILVVVAGFAAAFGLGGMSGFAGLEPVVRAIAGLGIGAMAGGATILAAPGSRRLVAGVLASRRVGRVPAVTSGTE